MVFEILYILSGFIEKDRIVLLKEYEDRFVKDCIYYRGIDIIVEYVIVVEKFNFKNLFLKVIESVRYCVFCGNWIEESEWYFEILDKSKYEIYK